MTNETYKLIHFRKTSDKFIEQVLGQPVPWLACAGPSTWQNVYGQSPDAVYVWEIDTTEVSAGKLMTHRHLLHDISTSLSGIKVRWKNHVGLGLVFDERPDPTFPLTIALPDPPDNNYLIPLGTDIQGRAVWKSLRETKNIIVAGSTQYGKTTGFRVWLTALTQQHSPDELQLALVDGKDFELVAFENSPYLPDFMQGRVATEVEEVDTVTTALVAEIKRRRCLFRQYRVSNTTALVEKGGTQLPVIVLLVDELKDLLDAGLDPLNLFRVAQQGAGLDIYVILGTQRPDADTVKKSNFATLVAYRLANSAESQVIFTTHQPYHTLKAASPGELVVLGPGLDYQHLKGFYPHTHPVEVIKLSPLDRILVRVALRKHKGDCSVGKVHQTIKAELPEQYWQAGGPFTYYRLQSKFNAWEELGWLTKAQNQNIGRQVTPKLKRASR